MNIIELPTSGFITARHKFISYATDLIPPLGGEEQKIIRAGSRFQLDITLAPRSYAVLGSRGAMQWISKLNQALEGEALFPFPQPDLNIPAPGIARVNGAEQQGMTLNADGLTANWPWRDGQFFSIEHNSNHYLHHFTDDGSANVSGQAALPIFPLLRASPADNSLLHITKPYIQGSIIGNQNEWTIDRIRNVGLSFSIREKR